MKSKRIYPELTLKPEGYKKSDDHCKIVCKNKHLEIQCSIDNTGNIFKLPYESIKGLLKV